MFAKIHILFKTIQSIWLKLVLSQGDSFFFFFFLRNSQGDSYGSLLEGSKSIYCAFVLICVFVCVRESGILIVIINIVSCLLYLKDFFIIIFLMRGNSWGFFIFIFIFIIYLNFPVIKSNLIQCWSLWRFLTWDLLNTKGLDCLETVGLCIGHMVVCCLAVLLGRDMLPQQAGFILLKIQ